MNIKSYRISFWKKYTGNYAWDWIIFLSIKNQKLTGESNGLMLEFGIEMLRYSCKQLQKGGNWLK